MLCFNRASPSRSSGLKPGLQWKARPLQPKGADVRQSSECGRNESCRTKAALISVAVTLKLIRTISMGNEKPKCFNIRLMSLMPFVLAALSLKKIFRGRPLASIGLTRSLVAAGLLRRFDRMTCDTFAILSTIR